MHNNSNGFFKLLSINYFLASINDLIDSVIDCASPNVKSMSSDCIVIIKLLTQKDNYIIFTGLFLPISKWGPESMKLGRLAFDLVILGNFLSACVASFKFEVSCRMLLSDTPASKGCMFLTYSKQFTIFAYVAWFYCTLIYPGICSFILPAYEQSIIDIRIYISLAMFLYPVLAVNVLLITYQC